MPDDNQPVPLTSDELAVLEQRGSATAHQIGRLVADVRRARAEVAALTDRLAGAGDRPPRELASAPVAPLTTRRDG